MPWKTLLRNTQKNLFRKRRSPHKLRSTFGTSLYRETGDIYLVADVLEHSDVGTTRKTMPPLMKDGAGWRLLLLNCGSPEDRICLPLISKIIPSAYRHGKATIPKHYPSSHISVTNPVPHGIPGNRHNHHSSYGHDIFHPIFFLQQSHQSPQKLINIFPLLFRQFQISLKLSGEFNFILHPEPPLNHRGSYIPLHSGQQQFVFPLL